MIPQRHIGRFGQFKGKSGIYRITNTITGNCYVGKSENIQQRFGIHFREINRGYGCNKKWSEDIRLHGTDVFEYEVLEEIPNKEPFYMAQAERKWFREIRPQYNRYLPLIPVTRWYHQIVKVKE